jgi:hypothetical protein
VFVRMTLHNLVLGWWGMISFFLTPIFILNNLGYFVQTLRLPSAASASRSALEDQREYALNLLATKDEATVIDVLAKQTGVPAPEVEAWVRQIAAARRAS